MFVFADETGHSGKHLFNAPAEFKLGALLSVQDPEPVLEQTIAGIKTRLGVDKLHANEHRVETNVENAHAIMDRLEDMDEWEFNLSVIEKPYVATTKFVDLLFDNGENSAVPPHWYQLEIFRHALCLACNEVLTEQNRERFWWAFLEGDKESVKSAVRNARTYALRLSDQKLRSVILQSFDFFLRKTEHFTIGAEGLKRDYQGHTPNVIAFTILMRALNIFAERHESPPIAFVHDRQDEFRITMKEWHKLWGGVIMDDHENGWWPKVRKVLHDLPKLTIGASENSPALQAVDTLLWIERKTGDGRSLKECQSRLQEKSNPHFIAPWMSNLIVEMRLKQAYSSELSTNDFEKARSTLDKIEKGRMERIRDAYN